MINYGALKTGLQSRVGDPTNHGQFESNQRSFFAPSLTPTNTSPWGSTTPNGSSVGDILATRPPTTGSNFSPVAMPTLDNAQRPINPYFYGPNPGLLAPNNPSGGFGAPAAQPPYNSRTDGNRLGIWGPDQADSAVTQGPAGSSGMLSPRDLATRLGGIQQMGGGYRPTGGVPTNWPDYLAPTGQVPPANVVADRLRGIPRGTNIGADWIDRVGPNKGRVTSNTLNDLRDRIQGLPPPRTTVYPNDLEPTASQPVTSAPIAPLAPGAVYGIRTTANAGLSTPTYRTTGT